MKDVSSRDLFSGAIVKEKKDSPNVRSRDAVKVGKSSRRHGSSRPVMHYSRSPGIKRWDNPWPDQGYKNITIQIPVPLYEIIEEKQALPDGTRIPKVEVITNALIIGLGVASPNKEGNK